VWLGRGIVAAVSCSGLLLSWAVERGSVERANRLYRDGAFERAAEIYRARLDDDADGAVRHGLGTALLALADPSAPAELELAAASPVVDVRARALYNRGLWSLRSALDDEAGDSLRVHAAAAVAANRSALRARPDHADTKWNLAIAQRLLDSIDAADRRSGRELQEGAVETDMVVRSENAQDVEGDDEFPEEAPREGEDEARAESDGEAALSLAEADEILGRSHLDPSLIVQKLLALEGRSAWGRRLRRSPTVRR
jgi:hypothetical protein